MRTSHIRVAVAMVVVCFFCACASAPQPQATSTQSCEESVLATASSIFPWYALSRVCGTTFAELRPHAGEICRQWGIRLVQGLAQMMREENARQRYEQAMDEAGDSHAAQAGMSFGRLISGGQGTLTAGQIVELNDRERQYASQCLQDYASAVG